MTGSESKPPAAADTAERIAFRGLGIMGSRMARNLRAAGFDVVVWNRTRSRAEELGEPIADTPRAAADGAGVVITSGVTVGERCVIGANSVVTQDLPPFSIAAGAPARVLRSVREGDS